MRWTLPLVLAMIVASCGGHSAGAGTTASCSSGERQSLVRSLDRMDAGLVGMAARYITSGGSPADRAAVASAIHRDAAATKRASGCLSATVTRRRLAANASFWRQYPRFARIFRAAAAGL